MPGSVSHAKRHSLASSNDHVGQLLKAQQVSETCYTDESNVWSSAQNLPTGSQINGEAIASEAFVEAAVQVAYIVQSRVVTDPSTLTPSTGERWVVGVGAIGVWAGKDNDITEWNGISWDFETPTEGWKVWILDEDMTAIFNGTIWVPIGSTVTHGNLIGLSNDDHPGHPWMVGRSGGQDIIGDIDGGGELGLFGDINNDGTVAVGNDGSNDILVVDESSAEVSINNEPVSGVKTGTIPPNGAVIGHLGQLYFDTIGTIMYICKSIPSGISWIVV